MNIETALYNTVGFGSLLILPVIILAIALAFIIGSKKTKQKTAGKPMIWYKVLIYFILPLSVASNALESFDVIRRFTLVSLINIIIPVTFTLVGILTWNALVGFKKKAPKYITVYFVLAFALPVLRTLLFSNFDFKYLLNISTIISFLIYLLIISVNHSYFKKRAGMFVR